MHNNHDALNLLMEECAEVIQCCSKIIRFGPQFVNPNTRLTNEEELHKELGDLLGVTSKLKLDLDYLQFNATKKVNKMKTWAPEALEERNDEPRHSTSDIS